MDKDKYFSVKEVAEILKTTENTIRRYIKDGKIKATRFGLKWLIPATELNMEDNKAEIDVLNGENPLVIINSEIEVNKLCARLSKLKPDFTYFWSYPVNHLHYTKQPYFLIWEMKKPKTPDKQQAFALGSVEHKNYIREQSTALLIYNGNLEFIERQIKKLEKS